MKKILTFASVITIALVFVLMNITAFSMYLEDNGYLMPKNEIESIMIDNTQISAPSISMLSVTEDTYIYERMSKYYTEDKKEVDLNYPSIIRDGKAMKFILGGAYLIDTEFVYAGLSNGDIVAGHTHFTMDGHALGDNTQMLAQLKNGLYIATTEFVVDTKLDSYTIKPNSIIYFTENFINVYQYYGGGYEYLTIRGLQGATITYVEEELSYADFYDRLSKVSGRIEDENARQEELEDEIIEEAESYQEDKDKGTNSKPEGSGNLPTGEEDDDSGDEFLEDDKNPTDTKTDPKPYVKPEVSVGNIYEWVYAINGDISISDEAGRIIGGVYFNVYDETGRLVLNRPVTSSGIMIIGSLEPDSIYTIEGYFEYYDENNTIVFEQCLELTAVKTLEFEGNIPAIRINYTLSEYTQSKAMVLDGLGLQNPVAYDSTVVDSLENLHLDILPYVYVLTFEFEDPDGSITTTRINTNLLSSLKEGELLDYITSEVLLPSTTYKYKIIPGDRYGNELSFVSNYSGTYTTSKVEPKVFINTAATGVGSLEMDLSFQDLSEAMVDDYYTLNLYYMGDIIEVDYEIGGVSSRGSDMRISTANANTKVLIKNLPYSIPLMAQARGGYEILDGRGVQVNKVIGESSFYSASVPTGTITFVNEFTDVAGTRVTVDAVLSENSTRALSQILTDINLVFTGNDQEVSYQISKEMFDSVDVESNYDEASQSLTIQVQDRYTFLPGIKLYASKEVILEYGAWQTLLNTAIYGLDPEYSGKVELNMAQNVLESATTYKFAMEALIVNETSSYDISSITVSDTFTTLKQEPFIYYEDFFISGNFIEIYNLTVTDTEDAIIGNTAIMQLWEDDVLIDSDYFDKNTLIEVERSDLLRAGYTYTLKFIAPEYNLTPYANMTQYNFVMLEYSFKHEEGLRAAIELEGFRSSYGGIDTSGNYGYLDNNYTVGKAFDKTSLSIVDKEGYFVTDYFEYKGNSQYYSIFKDFVSTGSAFTVAFYDASYKYIGYWETTTFGHLRAINDYTAATQFAYSNAKYVRINGTVDKIEAAYYYQYQDSDVDVLVSNLDTSNILVGKEPNRTSATDKTSTTLSSSDYINCTPGEVLNFRSSSYGLTIYFYDEQGVYKSNYTLNRTQAGAWVVPTGATQLRVVLLTDILENDNIVYELSRVKGANEVSPEATLKWSLYDTSGDTFFVLDKQEAAKYSVVQYINEITKTPDYSNPSLVSDYNITLDADGNISVEMLRKEDLEPLKAYRYELLIEYNGREVLLDSIEFNTNDLIYLVRESGDLDMIHYDGYGQYLVMNDIVENVNDTIVSRYFGGTLDFRGYSYTMMKAEDTSKTVDAMFHTLYRGGVIKNGEIILADNINHRHFISTNYGNVENMKFTIEKSIQSPMTKPLIETNDTSGVIDTFLIEFNDQVMLLGTSNIGVLTTTNNGTIRNGYTYNTNPEEGIYIYGSGGVFSYTSGTSSVIENIYVDLDMYWNYTEKPTASTWYTGMISVAGSGRFSNMYGITTRYNFTYDSATKTATKGGLNTLGAPLFGLASTTTNYKDGYKDIYLMSSNSTSTTSFSSDFDAPLLYDINWSENALGSDSNFRIEESIIQGFFPILEMDESIFYSQPYRPLPELTTVTTPEILSVKVSKEMQSYTDVEVTFNNPNKALITNIGVKSLSTVVINQITSDDLYVVTLRLSDPIEYVDEYYITSFTYKVGSIENTIYKSSKIDVSFYYPIYTIEDWAYLDANPTVNARLMNDLDFTGFEGEWEDVRVASTFSGTLDGTSFDVSGAANGRYKIKNVSVKSASETDDSFEGDGALDEDETEDEEDEAEYFAGSGLFFSNITGGSITNLEFENISWDNQGGEYTSLIHWAIQSDFEYVFVDGITMTSTLNVSPFIAATSGVNIINCGLNNVHIRAGAGADSFGAAGMIGTARYTKISNSYVTKLDVLYESNSATTSSGVGGIVGTTSGAQSYIENCYTTGVIENPRYNGGIVGNGTPFIDQCFSDVKIVAVGDYNGGISASTSTTNAYISNSLAIGNFIVMLAEFPNTHRISTTKNWDLSYNNYAYNGQTFNGLSIGNDDANALLSYETLTNGTGYVDKVNLGNKFDYSDKKEGMTPKVLDTDGNILPYQPDNYLLDDDVSVTVDDTRINEDGSYTIDVTVNHGNYTVESITIENMRLLEDPMTIGASTESGTTCYELDTRKTKALDYYRMVTTLADPNTGHLVEMSTSVYFGEPLYWEISNEYEWQDVMRLYGDDNQNILITGTVDFSKIAEPVIGVTVARFNGVSPDVSIIKGLTLTDDNSDNEGLIKVVNTNIGYITFQDMTIDRTTDDAGVRTSFIEVSSGTAKELIFDNCNITLGSAVGYTMGLFGQVVSVDNVEIKNCDISSKTNSYRAYYSGILAGRASGDISNVNITDSSIDVANAGYIGGAIGIIFNTGGLSNIHGDNLIVGGAYLVGGITGSFECQTTDNITIKNSEIKASYLLNYVSSTSGYRIGGISGRTHYNYYATDVDGYCVEDVTITGSQQIGGVTGYGGAYDAQVRNVKIIGQEYAGGIIGYCESNFSNLKAVNVYVLADYKYAGGITGSVRTLSDAHVFDSEIIAGEQAGGIAGVMNNSKAESLTYVSVHDTTVTVRDSTENELGVTNGTYAGGIVGNVSKSEVVLQYNYAVNTNVTATANYVGGLYGNVASSSVLYSYSAGGEIESTGGSFVGGIAGIINNSLTTAGHFYGNHSTSNVKGVNYVGGIVGRYRISNSSARLAFYDVQSYGNVTATGEDAYVHGIGHFLEGESTNYFSSLYGGIAVYEGVLVNGTYVTDDTVSNVSDSSKMFVADKKDLTSYTKLTGNLSSGGYGSSTLYKTMHIPNAGSLGIFDVIIMTKTSAYYQIKLQNIDLPDGAYHVSIYDREGGTSLVNLAEISILNGEAYYNLSSEAAAGNENIYIEVSKALSVYGGVYFEGLGSAYDYTPIYIDGVQGNYAYSGLNEAISISVENAGEYQWYRISEGQGYDTAVKMNITGFSDSNGIEMDLAGIYYAVNESTKTRSQMFVYETNTFHQMYSDANGVILPYQATYYITDQGVINPSNTDLIVEGRVFSMVYREANDGSEFVSAMSLEEPAIDVKDIEFDVYSSGIDTINIEFDTQVAYGNDKQGLELHIYQGDEVYEYLVTDRILSVSYDYNEDFVVELILDDASYSKEIKASDLRSYVSVYDKDYYYKCVDGLAGSNSTYIYGTFVNVNGNKALDSEGTIYTLATATVDAYVGENFTQVNTVPLYTSQYAGSELHTYKNFSYNASMGVVIETIIFTKEGMVHTLSGETKRTRVGMIGSHYLEEKYSAYINEDYELIQWNSGLNLPDDTKLTDIVEVSDTFESTSSIVLLRYMSGAVHAYDYITGESIELEYPTEDMSFGQYAISLIGGLFDGFGTKSVYDSGDYDLGQEFIVELSDVSPQELEAITQSSIRVDTNYESLDLDDIAIESLVLEDIVMDENLVLDDIVATEDVAADMDMVSSNVRDEYVSVYNPQTQTYDTFAMTELVLAEDSISMEEKIGIATENGYEGTLNNMVVASKVMKARNSQRDILMYVLLTLSIAGLLALLVNKSKRNKVK